MIDLRERLRQSRKVLLVQPDYHHAQKSRNHETFLPLPLLKFASFLRDQQIPFMLLDFKHIEEYDLPHNVDTILVTTSFTYYSSSVHDCTEYLRDLYPHAYIVCGGIYATLLPEHLRSNCKCDEIVGGIVDWVEEYKPSYDLVTTDYQILHTSRGCIRNCEWCGTYKLEPQFTYKKSIRGEIQKKKLIFYDNNLLANPHITSILNELIRLRRHKKIKYCESQSGLDGRLLTQEIAEKLYEAGFKNPTIAWDNHYHEKHSIHEQITQLINAGYHSRDIRVFILYNHEITYKESEQKRAYLSRLGVQVIPCRYIPLTSTSDGYNPYKQSQEDDEYYIHPTWTDKEVRAFKRNCRQHNICKRFNWKYYNRKMEKKLVTTKQINKIQTINTITAERMGLFNPDKEQVI